MDQPTGSSEGNEPTEPREKGLDKVYTWAKLIFIAVLTCALGFWILNTYIEFHYNAQILAGPCQTCVALNPEWAECYKFLTTPREIYNPADSIKKINVSEMFSK